MVAGINNTPTFTVTGDPVAINPDATITDDDPNMASMTVSISAPQSGDKLSALAFGSVSVTGETAQKPVRLLGLEPRTYGLKVRCSTN
jgi:hypothetical protein